MEQIRHDTITFRNTVEAPDGVFQRLVFSQLAGMKEGHMRIALPSGRMIELGDRNSQHKAMIRIVRDSFFRKCAVYGDVGFGEAYVDGDWETNNITAVIQWFLLNVENAPTISGNKRKSAVFNILKVFNTISHRLRDNTVEGSRRNISEHYDLSNDFFANVLDRGMTYSSAYFSRPDLTLEQGQIEKYGRLCRQLQLRRTDHVLEIGSGWGGFAIHAAEKYGCRVTTITVSAEQLSYAQKRIQEKGLQDKIEIRFQDYRTITGTYDKIVSIEMLEAVGHRHMEAFFAKCHEVLKRDGLMGLQVIISPDSRYDSLRNGVDWIQKHIFPGSLLPSIARINEAINRTGDMFLHDLKDLGPHYARTLRQWCDNFNRNREQIAALGFDERFMRTWNYYFSYCEAAFSMKNISVVQMIYTRPNNALLSSLEG